MIPPYQTGSLMWLCLILDMDMIVSQLVTKGEAEEYGQIDVKPLCIEQTYDWDIPHTEGQTITYFYGDTITLPGENPVVIDENFTEDLMPGCVITGTNPMIKDMTQFDYSYGKVYETGVRHQFGFDVDAQRAFDQGFTEQDIRFFLRIKFFLRVGTKMREKLLDPNWGKIPEFSVTVTAPGCPPGMEDLLEMISSALLMVYLLLTLDSDMNLETQVMLVI